MNFKQWLHKTFAPSVQVARGSRRGKSRQQWRHRCVPMLERVEDRLAPSANTITVTGLGDAAATGLAGSAPNFTATNLRSAVKGAEALGGTDQIVFSSSLFSSGAQTIHLTIVDDTSVGNSALQINNNSNITILGPGGNNGLTLSAHGPIALRLFDVTTGASLTLENLTLTGGIAKGGHGGFAGVGGGGGGGGAAGMGGAIFNNGTLSILDSTLSGNTAQGGQGTDGSFIGKVAPGGGGGGGGLAGNGGNARGFNAPLYRSYYTPTGVNGPGGAGGAGGGGGGGFGGTYSGTGFEYTTAGGGGSFGGGGGGGGSHYYDSVYKGQGNGYGGRSFSEGSGGGGGGFGGGGGGAGLGSNSPGGAGFGGSAGNYGAGGNGAGMGGAVFNRGGSVTITDSTLSGNTAIGGEGSYQLPGTGGNPGQPQDGQGLGGAVFSLNGSLTVLNSTLDANTAANGGGEVYVYGGAVTGAPGGSATVSMSNTIAADSTGGVADYVVNSTAAVTSSGTNNNITSTSVSSFSNTVTGSPQLGPLQSNGGPTQTMALPLVGSPAINAGSNSAIAGVSADQRGFTRILGGTVDIGAYEDLVANIVVNTDQDYVTPNSQNNSWLSLREAVNLLNGTLPLSTLSTAQTHQITGTTGSAVSITFDTSLYGDTINLSNVGDSRVGPSAFLVNSPVEIDGPSGGVGVTLAIAAGTSMRFFDVAANGSLTLKDLTLSGGTAQGSAGGNGLGGAIYNQGLLAILDSTLTGNTTQGFGGADGKGGAVFNEAGNVGITNSTFYANSAIGSGHGQGGGLFNHNGHITVTNSTFSGNTAANGGTDVFNFSDGLGKTGAVNINNSILGQSGTTTVTDFGSANNGGNAPVNIGSNNLMSNRGTFPAGGVVAATDPQLGKLLYHGGPTSTMALTNGSAAINAGSNTAATAAGVSTDQRGFPRNATVDIGAFEFGVKGSQTITFSPLTSPVTFDVGHVTLNATSDSGLPVTYTVFSGPGSISGNTLTFTGVGTIVIQVNQAGDVNYNAASVVTQSLDVLRANQTINFNGFSGTFAFPVSNGAGTSTVMFGVGTVEILAGSSSGLGVTYHVLSGPGSISYQFGIGFLNVAGGGSIVVEADQAGNANYYPATPVQWTLVVSSASQTISFAPLSPVINGVGPIPLTATSSSGLPVTFKRISGPGTINGNIVTVTGPGSIVIEADQAGNSGYNAAPPVQQTLVVSNIMLIGSSAFIEGPAAGSDSDLVVYPSAWTATSNVPWLHATTASGTGIGRATFSFDANTGATRTGTLTIANFTLAVTQAGNGYVIANPLTTLVPSTTPGLNNANGVAVDGSGNVYIADTGNNAIKEYNPTTQQVTTLVSGLNQPFGVAVDKNGNVYFADAGNNAIKEWSATAPHNVTTLVSGLHQPEGVAVDGSGNVYIADTNYKNPNSLDPTEAGRILEWSPTNPQTFATLVSLGLFNPFAVAVDGAGNVYIANTHKQTDSTPPPDRGEVDEWNAVNGLTFVFNTFDGGTKLHNPDSLAVDGAGNVYVGTSSPSTVVEWNATTGQAAHLNTSPVGFPGGVAVDATGNVYIDNTGSLSGPPSSVLEVSKGYVPGSAVNESPAAGSDAVAVPSTQALTGLFAPLSDQSWLALGATANGVVNFSFSANTGAARTAHISLLGTQITVIQGAVAPALGSYTLLEGPAAGTDTDSVVNGGAWTVASNDSWLHISPGGTGSGLATFSFDVNPGASRTGTLTINGLTLTVIQAGNGYVAVGNVYVPTSPVHETSAAGSDALPAVLPTTTSLAPTSDQSWLTIGAVADGVVNFSFTANAGTTRTAHITLLGQQISVIQEAGLAIAVTPYTSAGTTYDGTSHTATGTAIAGDGEDFSADLTLTGTTHTAVGTYTDSWTFHDPTGTYPDASGTVIDSIGQATAGIAISPYTSGTTTFDGASHTATGIATGVVGEDLSGDLTLTATTHTNIGTYTDSWTFHDPTGTYADASGTVTDSIAQANAAIDVTGYTTTYDGNAHAATGTATGLNNVDLSADLVLSGTTHTNAGTYTDTWTFHDPSGIYADASGTVADSVAQASAAIVVTGYDTTYDGNAHTATGTATGLNNVDLSASLILGGTTHTSAGTYTDAWSFHDAAGNYADASGTVTDSIAQASAAIVVTGYTTTYDGNAHTATGTATGVNTEDLSSGLTLIGTMHTNAGTYTDSWSFHDAAGNYQDASGTVTDSIAQASAAIVITPYTSAGTTYDGNAHTATGTATGVNNEDLSGGLTLTGTAHTNAGTYTDAWSFHDASGNYADASGTVTDSIAQASAAIVVTGYSVTYDGNAHTATGTATGINSEDLGSGLTLTGTTHTNAGTYTDSWSFHDAAGNYADASGTVTDSIAQASATIVVTGYTTTYDGNAHTATGIATGVNNEDLSGLTLAGTTHTNAGTYTDAWSFHDAAGNYSDASGTVTDSISQASATIVVTGYTTTYDGNAHTATGTATGVNNEDLSSGLTLAGTTHTNAGTYTDSWTFHDAAGNYQDASGTVTDSIAQASASIVVTAYSTTYDGNIHTATGTAAGVNNEDLSGGLTLTGTAHTHAGTYTDSWSFHDATGNYQDANGTVTDSIAQASAAIVITPYTSAATTYDGNGHTATGTATGVNNEDLSSGLTLTGTTHTHAGTYADAWSFHDASGNYQDASGTVTDSIAQASAAIVITPYTSAATTYDGNVHTATGTATGVNNLDLSSSLTLTGTTHTNAGTYTDAWSFHDATGNYQDASGTVTDSIAKADAVVVVTPYTVTYDGHVHTASVASITGVNGESGATVGTVALNTSHTGAGIYTGDSWSFTGAANYNDIASTSITDTINKAGLTITANNDSKFFGTLKTFSPTAFTEAGLINGDSISGVTETSTGASATAAVGSYPIVPSAATGIGLSNYNIQYVNGILTVTSGATTTMGSASTSSPSLAQTVTFTASVTPSVSGAGTPAGAVDFLDTTTGVDLGMVPLSSGVARLSTSNLTFGVNTISLSYSGDGSFLPSSTTVTVTVGSSILLLDPHVAGAISMSDNSVINENGPVFVDSNSASAIQLSGNAQLTASTILDVGGYQRSGKAVFHPTPTTGSASVADPFADVPAPALGASQGAINLGGNQTKTLNPGTFGQLNVSGNAKLTLNPGIYVLTGGLVVSGNATITGSGVLIYNAGGAISLSGNSLVTLTAPSNGRYAGISIYQARSNSAALTITGNAMLGTNGVLYASAAALVLSGNSNLSAPLIVDTLALSGNADPSPTLPSRPGGQTSVPQDLPAFIRDFTQGSLPGNFANTSNEARGNSPKSIQGALDQIMASLSADASSNFSAEMLDLSTGVHNSNLVFAAIDEALGGLDISDWSN